MKILAIGAHPDYIEPQIGGTLAKFAAGGAGSHSHNYYSDISNFHESKVKAVMCYESQIKKYVQAWLEAITARDRGLSFNIGSTFAEVAHIDKWIS